MITCSIVLYNTKKEVVEKAIKSFLNTNLPVKLYLVDNSPNNNLKILITDSRIKYIFNNANLGFGKAHNMAIKIAISENSKYHLILNPDVYFYEGVIEKLWNFMENNPEIGQIMPKVLYPNGSIQYLCKLLPSPFDLIYRRFLSIGSTINNKQIKYELRFTNYNKIMEIPSLSGCFMFIRTSVFEKIGLFDERFFMYLEDVDLTRRINSKFKTIFYPFVEIYHEYEKESYKNYTLLLIHLKSAIKYFNKWGWYDKERKRINLNTLKKIQ